MKNEAPKVDVLPSNTRSEPADLAGRIEAVTRDLKQLALAIRRAEKDARKDSQMEGIRQRAGKVFADLRDIERQCNEAGDRDKEQEQRLWLELEATTKEICRRNGWRVDGSWPSFMIAYGIQIGFDEKERTIQVGSQRVGGRDVTRLEAVISEQAKLLIPRDFSPEAFLELLLSAYQDAKRSNSQVPIFDIYRAVVIRGQRSGFWRNAKQERFSGLSIEQFRARLTRTVAASALKTQSGRELRLFPPLDPKDALFLYNPIDRRLGFVGRLEFSEPAEKEAS